MSARGGKIKAGEAFIELYIKDDKLKARLRGVRDGLFKFGKGVAAVGAIVAAAGGAILAPFVQSVKVFAENGEALTKMSERTGIATTMLSKLDYVARQSGTSLDDVEKAIRHFQQQGRSTDAFLPMLESIAAIPNYTVRTERALQIFGKRGTFLLPMIEQLHALGHEFDKFGRSAEQIKAGDELATQFTRLRKIIHDAMNQLAASVLPIVKPLIEWFIQLGKVVAGLIRDFPLLSRVAAVFGVTLLAVGTALVAVAGAAIFASAAFAALDVLASPWLFIAAGIAAIVVELMFIDAMLAKIAYDFLRASRAGRMLLETALKPIKAVLDHFKDFGKHLQQTWGALVEALRLGEIGIAWEILTIGMAAAWHELTAKMLRDLIPVLETLKTIANFTLNFAGGAILDAAAKRLKDVAAGSETAAAAERGLIATKAEALRKEREKNDKAGNRRFGGLAETASVIGFNSRAALMGRQVIGGGRDSGLRDTMSGLLQSGATTVDELRAIRRKMGRTFE